MMEKQNRIHEKQARGDSGELDDLVDGAAKKFAKPHAPKRHYRNGAETLTLDQPAPQSR